MIIHVIDDIIIGDSEYDEEEIAIKDSCGRFIPIRKESLAQVIDALIEFDPSYGEEANYINVEEGKVTHD